MKQSLLVQNEKAWTTTNASSPPYAGVELSRKAEDLKILCLTLARENTADSEILVCGR